MWKRGINIDIHVFTKKDEFRPPNLHVFLQEVGIYVKNLEGNRIFFILRTSSGSHFFCHMTGVTLTKVEYEALCENNKMSLTIYIVVL